ncbi:MAG TPA: efflux RND transporter periplasmic adaptor subunit [Candidatus Kryptonia bacterium]|nr:efflux RND transporter periplasmic adaptor subunit [Candidatus Kryptonia bacterium]
MTSADPERHERLRADLASLRLDRGGVKPAPSRRSRRRMSVWFLAVAVVVGLGAGLWAMTSRAPTVTVGYATLSTPEQSGPLPVLSGSGYIVTGDRYVSIGVRVPGRIDRYFVEEGQSVKQGAPLVQLDDRDYRAAVTRTEGALAVARANRSLADADLQRGLALYKQGVVSQQELDVYENKATVSHATVTQLEAELAQARVNLEYTTLHAPTDGVILAKLKEVGEIAVPGGFAGSGDLIRLANLNDMRAQVDVNEADLNRVRMGQPAQVTPDAYNDAHYAAEVVKLYPQVDRQKGTLRIEVHILQPDERLLPDMSARITFLSGAAASGRPEAPAVLAPAAALRRDAQGNAFVWRVGDGRAYRTPVEPGGNVGDRVRIANGLKGGEALVVSDDSAVRDGGRIKIASASP